MASHYDRNPFAEEEEEVNPFAVSSLSFFFCVLIWGGGWGGGWGWLFYVCGAKVQVFFLMGKGIGWFLDSVRLEIDFAEEE